MLAGPLRQEENAADDDGGENRGGIKAAEFKSAVCQRLVEQITGGVAAGVEVGNFFEFKGCLQTGGEHVMAAKKEKVGVFGIFLSDGFNMGLKGKHLFHNTGELAQVG